MDRSGESVFLTKESPLTGLSRCSGLRLWLLYYPGYSSTNSRGEGSVSQDSLEPVRDGVGPVIREKSVCHRDSCEHSGSDSPPEAPDSLDLVPLDKSDFLHDPVNLEKMLYAPSEDRTAVAMIPRTLTTDSIKPPAFHAATKC